MLIYIIKQLNNSFLRSHSKSTSLRIGGGFDEKSHKTWHSVERLMAKSRCNSLKIFQCPLFLQLYFYWSLETLIILQLAEKSAHPKGHVYISNSHVTTFKELWFHNITYHFWLFLPPFEVIWHAEMQTLSSGNILDNWKPSTNDENYFLFHLKSPFCS